MSEMIEASSPMPPTAAISPSTDQITASVDMAHSFEMVQMVLPFWRHDPHR